MRASNSAVDRVAKRREDLYRFMASAASFQPASYKLSLRAICSLPTSTPCWEITEIFNRESVFLYALKSCKLHNFALSPGCTEGIFSTLS
ncbi:Uncharacterised protein [Segatella copri]|nr:Uncharacterised protein [Segatella copri]